MERYLPLGHMVLAGSGEYTPAMDMVDNYLLEQIGSGPILLIATSCAQEGLDVMERWERMGVEHFRLLGAAATPLRIVDRDDADKTEFAEQIAGASLVWFSGGSPPYLTQTFQDTACFRALEEANRKGTAVAGSSGGLGVLNHFVPDSFADTPLPMSGLGLASPVRALAHFDRMEMRRPDFVERLVAGLAPDNRIIGTDEDTAAVWTGSEWRAMGHKRVVVFLEEGERVVFSSGETINLLPPPTRSLPAGD